MLKALDAAGKTETDLLTQPNDIFYHGISVLDKGKALGGWDMVRIYAPVGLWDTSTVKDQWLKKLQEALGDITPKIKIGDVKAFRAVYGLPSSSKSYYDYAKRIQMIQKSIIYHQGLKNILPMHLAWELLFLRIGKIIDMR